jgi:hypothetical protein
MNMTVNQWFLPFSAISPRFDAYCFKQLKQNNTFANQFKCGLSTPRCIYIFQTPDLTGRSDRSNRKMSEFVSVLTAGISKSVVFQREIATNRSATTSSLLFAMLRKSIMPVFRFATLLSFHHEISERHILVNDAESLNDPH